MIAVPCDATRGSTRSERDAENRPPAHGRGRAIPLARRKAASSPQAPGEKLVTRHARRLLDGLGEEGFKHCYPLARDSVVSKSVFTVQ